jgi:hypothetical protein
MIAPERKPQHEVSAQNVKYLRLVRGNVRSFLAHAGPIFGRPGIGLVG